MIEDKNQFYSQMQNFEEIIPPLSDTEAVLEANLCLFCDDAPCVKQCPTAIDIPMFIRKISTKNLKGSAKTIFDANPLGASCARVCPTEQLCEGACVLGHLTRPIMIGRLQRYATDFIIKNNVELYHRTFSNSKSVAIVGSGPSGLAAARNLALEGYSITIFESNKKAGGLNTYGIPSFRLPQPIALWETDQIRALGVDIQTHTVVGQNIELSLLVDQYDAVLLAIGMDKINPLGIRGESLPGVLDALSLIEQVKDLGPANVTIGKKVVVIGAGNTAIDAATTAKRLGAEVVQIIYRRTEAEMTAYPFEYEFAKSQGIQFHWLTMPKRVLGDSFVEGIECLRTNSTLDKLGKQVLLSVPNSELVIEADTVILATGQSRHKEMLDYFGIVHQNGVVLTDEDMHTSHPKIYAAGDLIFVGDGTDATVVSAVEQGKCAARSIHKDLEKNNTITLAASNLAS